MATTRKKLKITEHTVIHCPTEELAKKVTQIAKSLGYKWSDGEDYKYHFWNRYGDRMCYLFSMGYYCSVDYYKEHNYDIMEAEEFLQLHNK